MLVSYTKLTNFHEALAQALICSNFSFELDPSANFENIVLLTVRNKGN